MKTSLFRFALSGSVLALLCCVTPLLPVFLGAVGAGALIPILYRDVVLLPVLAGFLVLGAFALWRHLSARD